MAIPAYTEPPGELMYSATSRLSSSADSRRISAQILLAMSSSTCWPRKTMRCRSNRWNSRSPGITGASGVAVLAIGRGCVTWSPAPITSGVVERTLTPLRGALVRCKPLFATGARRCALPGTHSLGEPSPCRRTCRLRVDTARASRLHNRQVAEPDIGASVRGSGLFGVGGLAGGLVLGGGRDVDGRVAAIDIGVAAIGGLGC